MASCSLISILAYLEINKGITRLEPNKSLLCDIFIDYMRRQQLFRHSSQCHERCLPGPDEDLYSHEDNTAIHHEYIRHKHLQEHIKKYQSFTDQNLKSFKNYHQALLDKLTSIKNEIEAFQRETNDQVRRYIENFQSTFFKDEKDRLIVSTINDFNFEPLTCFEMGKLIKLTDVSFLTSSESKFKIVSERKIKQIEGSFEELLKRVCQLSGVEVISHSDKNLLNMMKLNESSIVRAHNDSFVPDASDDIGDLKGAYDILFSPLNNLDRSPPITMIKNAKIEIKVCTGQQEKKYDIVEEEEDESYYNLSVPLVESKMNESLPLYQDKSGTKEKAQVKLEANEMSKKETKQGLTLSKQQEKTKRSRLKKIEPKQNKQSEFQSESQEGKEDNEQQINKATKIFEEKLSQNLSGIISEDFLTISDLDDILDSDEGFDQIKFNIRVQVVKVIYFCVIFQKYLKVKFIAGDETGIGVFFTNYWNEIKPGCEIQLTNCKFKNFRGSDQIHCDKDYRKINEGKNTIIVNLDGVRLTPYIEDDLYYQISDRNCTLIRRVAERLAENNAIRISRMIVKVVFILNEWANQVFCQIGDSSGLMLAYLKKESMKSIVEGNVVKLTHISAKRGQEPNRLINEEIIYIDTIMAESKVIPFEYEFLEISDKIMTV